MLPGFEEFTYELDEYEKNTLLPAFLSSFKKRIGKEKAITNKEICAKLQAGGFIITDSRVRKIVNYIRTHNLIDGLIATSKGYYISRDTFEVKKYIESLEGRENEIRRVKEKMISYLQSLIYADNTNSAGNGEENE